MAFLKLHQVYALGLKSFGRNVLISDKASFYSPGNIAIGDNVRIDDFCILSAGKEITLGNYIHIGAYSSLVGKGRIVMEDFSGLAFRCSIYSSNDNYSGDCLTNPLVPEEFTGVTHADVRLCKYVIVGTGAVILPGVTLNQGVAIGALSLVNQDCEEFYIYKGNPARKLMPRSRNLLEVEKKFKNHTNVCQDIQ